MFGSHLSIAGGLHLAIAQAAGYGMDAVQIFTKNQRQWTPPALTDEMVRLFTAEQKKTGLKYVVSHDSYLINLASPDAVNAEKSESLFRDELQRCEALGIPDLVMHPGAHMGEGEEAGLKRVIDAFDRIHRDLPGLKVTTCVEVTAGQGSSLGFKFEHIKTILEGVAAPERMAVCLDTAHLIEAGYDLTSAQGAKATLDEADSLFGLDRVHCLHINDSKTARGSRVDRHEHIGLGHVALSAFGAVLKHSKLKKLPMILETPKGLDSKGNDWDLVNIEKLKSC